jgi:hypothetical protein
MGFLHKAGTAMGDALKDGVLQVAHTADAMKDKVKDVMQGECQASDLRNTSCVKLSALPFVVIASANAVEDSVCLA